MRPAPSTSRATKFSGSNRLAGDLPHQGCHPLFDLFCKNHCMNLSPREIALVTGLPLSPTDLVGDCAF